MSNKPRHFRSISIADLLAAFLVVIGTCISSFPAVPNDIRNEGGTIIVNHAEATYEDRSGEKYSTISPTVSVVVAVVPAITVTPDETAPSAVVSPNEQVTRLFRICNTGNRVENFVPTVASVSSPAIISQIFLDLDNTETLTAADAPVTLGQTSTPIVNTGTCVGVLFVVQTNNVVVDSQIVIALTARSSQVVSGTSVYPTDTGTIINRAAAGARFTSPTDPTLAPVKLVENLPRFTAAAGQVLDYSISFRNSGTVIARQVRVTDILAAELQYVPNTLRLDNRLLTDQADADEGTVTPQGPQLTIPQIAADAVTVIHFSARVKSSVNGNGIINAANISAANVPSATSTTAVVVVDPVGIVYAGNSLGSVRIRGASLTIAVDDNGTPLPLTGSGFKPNLENTNPFISDENGNFSFYLSPDKIGTADGTIRYILNVTAHGYRPRQIELLVAASPALQGLYSIKERALDGQPIAASGAFELTDQTVELADLAALVINVPMFDRSSLEISKVADKQNAEVGDIVSYKLTVKNPTAVRLTHLRVRDILPNYFVYAQGTAQVDVNGNVRQQEPEISGAEMLFKIAELPAGAQANISYRLRIGANATDGEYINVAFGSATTTTGTPVTTQPTKAVVRVRGGVFSMQQVLIGRVFEDKNGNGKFDRGERPVSGARIYTSNGQSVVTDQSGNYNLPAVNPGSLVVSLDPITLPDRYFLLEDNGRRPSSSWTRLLRTPLGGGTLLRQNFAIAPHDDSAIATPNVRVIAAKAQLKSPVPAGLKGVEPARPIQIASADPKKLRLGARPVTPAEPASTFTELAAGEMFIVSPGEVSIVFPKPGAVIMAPALSLTARVARDWTLETEINGVPVATTNLGEKRVDNRNGVTTMSFVGLNLKPGPNNVRVTPVDQSGTRGKTVEMAVFGRGTAQRIDIVSEKANKTSGGLGVEVRAFDKWGNPAQDAQVLLETSKARIFAEAQKATEAESGTLARQQMVTLKDGVAKLQLVADGGADATRLKVTVGELQNFSDIRFEPELRPTLMVGLAELAVGKSAPEIANTGDDVTYRARLALYYRGTVFGSNLLTLAYDSQKPLNRVAGRDRFGGFDPLERAYPVFGDSSQRFEDAQSNSKLYPRLDHGHSYVMFGDMDADLDQNSISGYSRRLTGVKLRIENKGGDFISLSGARPDTSFRRDLIPGGGLSILMLSSGNILPGSELVSLETRDRRNPEILISRESLIRSVDYNIDTRTGQIFFLRAIPEFDLNLNSIQIAVAYEYLGGTSSNFVYTGRAVKRFNSLGLRIGASYVNQQQAELGGFQLGGLDVEKNLWNGGKLYLEAGLSNGRFASGVNVFDYLSNGFSTADETSRTRNGTAVKIKLQQPLKFLHSSLTADFSRSSEDFLNPFGVSIASGARRLQIGLEMRPSSKRSLTLGFTDERNRTARVNNSRQSFTFLWSEQWRDDLRTNVGFEHRDLSDETSANSIDSSLVTAAVEYKPTDKIELSVKREQNLSDADPTYPTQTTFSARYKLNNYSRLFVTQRLAAAAISPIADLSFGAFSGSNSRRELAFGIETKISRLGALSGRYQVESGAAGSDNFAVIGLQNRWHLNEQVSIEAGFERGFHINGTSKSFNSGTFGAEWMPNNGFKASGRYELRDRNGFGQLFTVGTAGKIGDSWTTLIRGQFARTNFNNMKGSSSDLKAAAAYRPLDSDKYALLFSFDHRNSFQHGLAAGDIADIRDRVDTLSADGLFQAGHGLELYGKVALRFNANGNAANTYASNLTYLGQARAEQRIGRYLDLAAEGRWLRSPSSVTSRKSAGAELGFWVIPDLRFGLGYNFTQAGGQAISVTDQRGFRAGPYFTITTKLSNIFDLFGTARQRPAAAKTSAGPQH